MLILTIPEESRMPAIEAHAHEDGSVEVATARGNMRLTGKLSRPEQVLAMVAMSLAVRREGAR
jgi:hypothetical protein